MTLMAYTLSMPGCASWDGKWSGAGRRYVRVRSYRRSADVPEAKRYTHRWDDGWVAAVDVRQVDAAEARKLRRQSDGFCGYDWMISSIEEHGRIQFPESTGTTTTEDA